MGRTVIPVRYEAEARLAELERYVRSLRTDDRVYFENLMITVRKHVSSLSYANPLNPSELMQWSALIEMEKKISRLKHAVDRHLQSGE